MCLGMCNVWQGKILLLYVAPGSLHLYTLIWQQSKPIEEIQVTYIVPFNSVDVSLVIATPIVAVG